MGCCSMRSAGSAQGRPPDRHVPRRPAPQEALIPFFDSSRLLLALLDGNLVLLAASRSFADALGTAPGRAVGRPLAEVLDLGEEEEALRRACASGRPELLRERPLRPAAGTPSREVWDWHLLPASGGLRLVLVAADGQTEARAQLLREQSLLAVAVLQDGRVRFVNPLFARICDLPLEGVCRWSREDLLRALGEDLSGWLADAAGDPLPREACIRTPSGSLRWVEVQVQRAAWFSRPAEMITLVDSTEKKLMEETARLQQEAVVEAGRLASLGLLASGVAHEISNPNQIILSYTELLAESWGKVQQLLFGLAAPDAAVEPGGPAVQEVCEDIRAGIGTIMASCRKIGSFVDELRGYARSVDGDPREEVGIRRIVDGALQLTNHQILRATHSFRVDVGADLPPLQGSVRRLQQVIINLIEGSCFSYLERQRRCALQIVAGYDPGSRMITVRIEAEGPLDEGGGAAAAGFPALRRSELLGSTLGMAVSRSIVKEHGGVLQVIHEPRQGIRTCLKLPVGG